LNRIHRYTLQRLRSEIQPVSPADFMRFLFVWHQIGTEDLPSGPGALEQVLLTLEGYEAPAVAWESDIFPSRVADYDHPWLDGICSSRKITWGRFRASSGAAKDKTAASPVRSTPIAFISRINQEAWRDQCPGIEELSKSLSQRTL